MQGCFLTGEDIALEAAEANKLGEVRKTRLRPFRKGGEASLLSEDGAFIV